MERVQQPKQIANWLDGHCRSKLNLTRVLCSDKNPYQSPYFLTIALSSTRGARALLRPNRAICGVTKTLRSPSTPLPSSSTPRIAAPWIRIEPLQYYIDYYCSPAEHSSSRGSLYYSTRTVAEVETLKGLLAAAGTFASLYLALNENTVSTVKLVQGGDIC